MKKILLALIGLVVFINISNAQNDTMYFMKNGEVVGKYNVNNQVDSIVFHQSSLTLGNTFTDPRDGIVYQTVTIGNQIWMAENLKYLPSVVDKGAESVTIPYYYVYDYDGKNVAVAKATAYYNTYGVLYNWVAAKTACPTGWHLPDDAEWTELTDYLGGALVAGGKLKETGTTHWDDPNIATNESGFTALPGGWRYYYEGAWSGIGHAGYWWSATENGNYAKKIGMQHGTIGLVGGNVTRHKAFGQSVRCVRD